LVVVVVETWDSSWFIIFSSRSKAMRRGRTSTMKLIPPTHAALLERRKSFFAATTELEAISLISEKENLGTLNLTSTLKLCGIVTCMSESISFQRCMDNYRRKVSDTHYNTHFSTHFLWLVKSHMGLTKSCGSHIFDGSHMNFNQSNRVCWKNQIECVEKCVLEYVLLAFL